MRKLIIITAPRNSGKTTRMWKAFEQLKGKDGVQIGGYITKLNGPEDLKSEFTLIELHSGLEVPAISEEPPSGREGWVPMGKRYWFSNSAFDRACEYYKSAAGCTHLFMDEAGIFELEGRGYDPALKFLAEFYTGTLFVAVRDIFVEDFLGKYAFKKKWTVEVAGPSD